MTKTEIVKKVAEQNGVSYTTAKEIIDSFLESLAESVSNGDTVTLVGFGKFERVVRAKRVVQTFGQTLDVPEHYSIKFILGKALKETLESKYEEEHSSTVAE